MAPAEVNVDSLRRTMMTQDTELNDQMLHKNLDTLEEEHNQALLRIQNYQESAAQYYNKRVRDASKYAISSLENSMRTLQNRKLGSSARTG